MNTAADRALYFFLKFNLTQDQREELQRDFEEAIAAEREECAKIADSLLVSGFDKYPHNFKIDADAFNIGRRDRCRTIAALIRERGVK